MNLHDLDGVIVARALCISDLESAQIAAAPIRHVGKIAAVTGMPESLTAFLKTYSDAAQQRDLEVLAAGGQRYVLRRFVLTSIGPTVDAGLLAIVTGLQFVATDVQLVAQQADTTSAPQSADAAPESVAQQAAQRQHCEGDGMQNFTFAAFQSMAGNYGLTPDQLRDCGNGHWQAKVGPYNVNVYPYAHPPKYVLQGSDIKAEAVEGHGSISELVGAALGSLVNLVRGSQERQMHQQAQAESQPSHLSGEQVLAQIGAMRQNLVQDLKQLKNIESLQIHNHTTIEIVGTLDEAQEGQFLAGKYDGLLTAYKLVADLGEKGVELILAQANALGAQLAADAQAAKQAEQPAAAGV